MHAMGAAPEQSRRNRIGLTRAYCLNVAFFFAMGVLGVTFSPAPGAMNHRLFGAFFLAISGLGVLWPFLRLREREGLRFTRLKSRQHLYAGILVPVSPASQIIIALGCLVFAALSLTVALRDPTASARYKGWLGFSVFLGAFFVFLATILKNKPGILLNAEGIAWNEYFHGPAFIPWDTITRAEAFHKKEKYNSSPAFGLTVVDFTRILASLGTIGSAKQRLKIEGYHFIYMAESLLYPVSDLALIVRHYLRNPKLRTELSTGTALDKLPQILRPPHPPGLSAQLVSASEVSFSAGSANLLPVKNS